MTLTKQVALLLLTLSAAASAQSAAPATAAQAGLKSGDSLSLSATPKSGAAIAQDVTLTSDGMVSDADPSVWSYEVIGKGNRTTQLLSSHGGALLTYVDYPANTAEATTVCVTRPEGKTWKTATGFLLVGDPADLLDTVNITNVSEFKLADYAKLAAANPACTLTRK